jgi:hypothetical protein
MGVDLALGRNGRALRVATGLQHALQASWPGKHASFAVLDAGNGTHSCAHGTNH